ncbi:hypothetical protein [Cognatilysobacter bugurensis]|uniref:Uncharacterized protein n=1 Tax=Cognatilysobacter bugurensis TaxID=543356 RepID=A0A918SY03_9GAMM|nr:hypothetical protein [Lysobacter bugurensis]GHA77482.1 hypothetical protein GCM10007067_13640 [Lysobacter bugurensis]
MDKNATRTLREHRKRLHEAGERAYAYEIEHDPKNRLCKTLCPHLRAAGFDVTPAAKRTQLKRIIGLLFAAQDHRPMFHVEGTELPLCWNSPKNWEFAYIKYEWGHVMSRNQNAASCHSLENLGLYSARCNQHIQTSLDVPELMQYGGIIAQRVSIVLTNRRKLFASQAWQEAVSALREISPNNSSKPNPLRGSA